MRGASSIPDWLISQIALDSLWVHEETDSLWVHEETDLLWVHEETDLRTHQAIYSIAHLYTVPYVQ